MHIAIVTDAWFPQINGVVRTLAKTAEILEGLGHTVQVVGPEDFHTLPCPTYPEIRLSLAPMRRLTRRLEAFAPDAVHIATEGPLGMAARRWCLRRGRGFTTSYHTRFPEYLRLRIPVPLSWSYRYLLWFHRAAARTFVATPSIQRSLRGYGFQNLVTWSRGVDTELFRPRPKSFLQDPRPLFMYAGRVAVEKSVEDFLLAPLPGTKYVVGDGPGLADLRQRYPEVRFTGYKVGLELARYMAAADVLVFPSRTDTFGLVLIEAMACGVPVAAYPVPGPADLVREGENGCLDEDLARAAMRALEVAPASCRAAAEPFSWDRCTRQFLDNLHLDPATRARLAADPRVGSEKAAL